VKLFEAKPREPNYSLHFYSSLRQMAATGAATGAASGASGAASGASGGKIGTIGILGTGDVSKVLAEGFAIAGYTVVLGTRDPVAGKTKLDALLKKYSNIHMGTFAEAATRAEEIVVFAPHWGDNAAETCLKLAGEVNLRGKIVIDTCNPLTFPANNFNLHVGYNSNLLSAGELVQQWMPQSRVVKAFNHIGYKHMLHPDFKGIKPDMWICGNDAAAKVRVQSLITGHFGYPAANIHDFGPISESRHLETLALVWLRTVLEKKSDAIGLAMVQK